MSHVQKEGGAGDKVGKYKHPFLGDQEPIIYQLVQVLLEMYDTLGEIRFNEYDNYFILLVEFFAKCNNYDVEEMLSEIERLIKKYVTSPTVRDAYLKIFNSERFKEEFRKFYNKVKAIIDLKSRLSWNSF